MFTPIFEANVNGRTPKLTRRGRLPAPHPAEEPEGGPGRVQRLVRPGYPSVRYESSAMTALQAVGRRVLTSIDHLRGLPAPANPNLLGTQTEVHIQRLRLAPASLMPRLWC